ncbi:MAG: hypothetical protein HYV60_18820 [Planctomycetia bacterium]|nr:hypothetical protein [Planctomycetia bacterium]
MNIESPDELDRLLGDWAASREADDRHASRLANQILAAAHEESDVGRNKSAPFRHEPVVRPLPELRKALFRPTADWSGRLMIGGGLLLFLIQAGGLLYYNLTTVPPGNPRQSPPIAVSTNTSPPGASLGAAVLAAKRQLLTETNALFDDQLAWIADGEHEVSFEVREQAAQDAGEFMLVRVVVAQRASPDLPWSTVWQTDVISRSEALVEVAPVGSGNENAIVFEYRATNRPADARRSLDREWSRAVRLPNRDAAEFV